MKDSLFIRGKVPMTKAEVRAVSISKLELPPDAVVYDVGAGTGSVTIEMALQLPQGTVYAIERNSDAVDLLHQNCEKFGVSNVKIVPGLAPEAFEGLPVATHAFLGGTGGRDPAAIAGQESFYADRDQCDCTGKSSGSVPGIEKDGN